MWVLAPSASNCRIHARGERAWLFSAGMAGASRRSQKQRRYAAGARRHRKDDRPRAECELREAGKNEAGSASGHGSPAQRSCCASGHVAKSVGYRGQMFFCRAGMCETYLGTSQASTFCNFRDLRGLELIGLSTATLQFVFRTLRIAATLHKGWLGDPCCNQLGSLSTACTILFGTL